MGTTRIAAIPLDHVLAEVATFPLASEAALSMALTEMDPCVTHDTSNLWRHAESSIIGSFPSFSVDEVVAARDELWFNNTSRYVVPLHTYVERLANRYLHARGPTAVPLVCATSSAARAASSRRTWQWLVLAMPTPRGIESMPYLLGLVPKCRDSRTTVRVIGMVRIIKTNEKSPWPWPGYCVIAPYHCRSSGAWMCVPTKSVYRTGFWAP